MTDKFENRPAVPGTDPPTAGPAAVGDGVSRPRRIALGLVGVLRKFEHRSPRVERTLLTVAVLTFVAAAAVAYVSFPDVKTGIRWPLLATVAVLVVPAVMAVNALEFMISARLVHQRSRFIEAFRVSVLSSAANVLPIPGAVVVRTRALRQLGSGYRGALASTAAVGFVWVGTSAVLASGFMFVAGELALGSVFAAGGIAGVSVAMVLLWSQVGLERTKKRGLQLGVVELASTSLAALRMWLVLRGLGIDAGWADAFALALVAIVASASGIFPGGLGIREVMTAAFSPLLGIPASVGLALSAVERIIMFITLSVLAGIFLLRGEPEQPDDGHFSKATNDRGVEESSSD